MWTLRGYVVERLLGAGGSAEVWRARVATTGEAVALKRLVLPDAARARAEAAKLAVLDHPHLVRLHALLPAAGQSVLVLDLADGGSLANLLAARGRLTPGEVITAVSPVAAALAYLHAAGVVHGDVTPANILFTAGGIPLLADLGVARLTGDDSDAESTPAYVDPAVADGCVPAASSDVFMLAAVALHALTGAPPWPGPPEAALEAARAERFGDVAGRLAAAGVAPAMAAVLLRALDPEPASRGSAADFALELRHSGEPVAVELAAGRPAPAPASGGAGAGRSGGVRGACGAAASGAGGAAASGAGGAAASGAGGAAAPGARVWTGPRHAARVGTAPPTRSVGPRPRPALPRPPWLVRVALRARRRLAEPVGAAVAWWAGRPAGERRTVRILVPVAALAAVVAAALLVPRDGSGAAAAHGTRRPSEARAGARTGAAPTTGHATVGASANPSIGSASRSSPPATRTRAPESWGARLAALDAVRARAFAVRRPELLARVYLPGPLLKADTRLLLRLVPVGCGLVGVRTTFRDVHARPSGVAVELSVVASLPASQLMCAGRPGARAAPTAPTRLTLRLRNVAGEWRIAAQEAT